MRKMIPFALALSLAASSAPAVTDAAAASPEKAPILCKADQGQSVSDYFAPRPDPRGDIFIDYELFDAVLGSLVVYTGDSIRQQARRPLASVGSRVHYGHKSPYRYEGNKVKFEKISRDLKADLGRVEHEFIAAAHETDIPALPRGGQLAFWFNLHNAVMINRLAADYPVQYPARHTPEGFDAPLHDAKMITICGRDLSLRDIREKIVYAHWGDEPLVMYGFWHAEIGTPNLNYRAFSRYNNREILAENAREFINSYRGYRHLKGKRVISVIYASDGAQFFAGEAALEAHLRYFLRADLRPEFDRAASLVFGKPHPTIADLSGGQIPRYKSAKNSYDTSYMGNAAGHRMMVALDEKREEQVRLGLAPARTGTVTIEDIPTVEFKVKWSTPSVKEVTAPSPEPEQN